MPSPIPARLNLFLLYVADPLASVAFYQRLLDREPLDAFPSYAAFALEGGHTLGLWASHRVSPPPPSPAIAAKSPSPSPMTTRWGLHAHWQTLGVPIEQPPVAEVFGLTFVALDPDGHRIRSARAERRRLHARSRPGATDASAWRLCQEPRHARPDAAGGPIESPATSAPVPPEKSSS